MLYKCDSTIYNSKITNWSLTRQIDMNMPIRNNIENCEAMDINMPIRNNSENCEAVEYTVNTRRCVEI